MSAPVTHFHRELALAILDSGDVLAAARIIANAMSKERAEHLIETRRVLGTGLPNFKRWLKLRIEAESK